MEQQNDAIAEARAIVVEKLTALEVSRKVERDKRKEESQAQAAPNESIAKFLQEFVTQQQLVTCKLQALRDAAGSGLAQQQVQDGLDCLAELVLQMERSAANASYFLPSYDLKQSTAAAAELKQMIDSARAELVPKKKFAFSKKVNRVKGSELSTAAAEANPVGATPVSAGGTSISGGSAAGAPGVTSAGDAVGISPSQQDLALIQEGRGLRGLRNQVVVLTPVQIASKDFVLIDLQGCHVYLLGHLPALRMLGLKDTTIMAGPVTGACFADGLERCTIRLASYQVRIHRTTDTDFYLRVRSKPIIEHSTRVRFAPLAISAAESSHAAEHLHFLQLLDSNKLGQDTDLYAQVEDFGWIKASQSPNWDVLPIAARAAALKIPWGSPAKMDSQVELQDEV